MKKKMLAVSLLLILASTISAAVINLVDDDPVQYFSITQTQTVPTGASLRLYVRGTGTFVDVGLPPIGTEVTVRKGANTELVGNTLTIAYNTEFWMYTRYTMYIGDLDSTFAGPTSDTVHISVVQPVLPAGEAISVTLDK
jgi:hypothetical protein